MLLLQLTHGATDGKIGVSNPFSEYVKYLPSQIPIPTFWQESERMMLEGTSLEAALEAKLSSLAREFSLLQEKTNDIEWCKQYWWNADTGSLSFDDWKQVDAMYRSRALDLPGTGHAMVPCVDMANHASGDGTTALYETDADGNALLVLRDGKTMMAGDEITITYGDEKGACEMLFSYGFIESSMTSAKELFLDLEIPNDDPLKLAKKAVSKSAPGFRLFERENGIDWEGPFVWLLCINEEDGLEFKILQNVDGEQELQALWKENEITNVSVIEKTLEKEALWDVFNLRAISTLQARVEQQLIKLERSTEDFDATMNGETGESTYDHVMRLRDLEETLMLQAYEEFESKVIDWACPDDGIVQLADNFFLPLEVPTHGLYCSSEVPRLC